MSDEKSVLQRKVALMAAAAVASSSPPRAWRFAMAKAAQDTMALDVDVSNVAEARRSLAELLELPPERGLLAIIEGPGEALGLVTIAPAVLASMIEMQTMGKVSNTEPQVRKPTRTDAAMVSTFIDRVLEEFELGIGAGPDRSWASGYRYASFLDDPRPLGLLLEDTSYRAFAIDISLGRGQRSGQIQVVLPATGKPAGAKQRAEAPEVSEARNFSAGIAAQVMETHGVLEAVLHRMTIPLSAVMGLQEGDLVPLPASCLEKVMLLGIDGRQLGIGKLGQNRGMRAVRIAEAENEGGSEMGALPDQSESADFGAALEFDGAPMMLANG